jgi:soluble cytochrome b562
MAAIAIKTEIENSVVKLSARKGKGRNKMSDTQTVVDSASTGGEVKESQKTVFDLQKFDNILLKKKFQVPAKPTDIKQVLNETLHGDMDALLNLIHDGLVKQAQDAAYYSNEGWFLTDEKDEITSEPYSGNFASDNKRDMINAAVLTLAKLNGYDKSLSAEEKKAKKEAAMEFLRKNPQMLGGLQ